MENKEILLKYLCAALPYGVKVWYKYYPENVTEKFATSIRLVDGKIALSRKFNREGDWYPVEEANELLIKPYLRSMDSMNEEEAKEIANLCLHDFRTILSINVTEKYLYVTIDDGFSSIETITLWYDELISSIECIYWLLEHHFDFMGLIPKKLAIKITDKK